MSFEEFHNALRILRSIDLYEIENAGIQMGGDEWQRFRDDPYGEFIRMPQPDARCIWTIIYRRQSKAIPVGQQPGE